MSGLVSTPFWNWDLARAARFSSEWGVSERRRLHDLRALWQRVQERAPIGFGKHAWVEDHDDPPVGLRPDQAAETLLELDDGFGHLVFDEWAPAVAADVLE